MMRNVSVEYHESGLIISQEGVSECVVVPNFLKYQFYEEIRNVLFYDCPYASYNDLEGNRLLMNYEYKNKFNCFINGCYCGDLPFIPLSKTSIGIPVETDGTFDYFEVYDSILMECYLLEKEEVLRLTK